LKSSGQLVGRRMIYGGKDLWNRCVFSLEWKREEVMDGVMVVTNNETTCVLRAVMIVY